MDPLIRFRRRTWLQAALTAVILGWALADVSPLLYRPGEPTDQDTLQSGEMLLHGVRYGMGSENFHLPLATVSSALIFNHSPEGSGAFWRGASASAAVLLILALGVEFGALAQGLLGAALMLGIPRFHLSRMNMVWHGDRGHLQAYFVLLVLVTAALIVRLAREPTQRRAWLTALALGVSLLYRSTLVFLPPLLSLYLWRARCSRRDWRTPAIVVLVPYLFLLPWIAMNWSVHRAVIPLEHGEAAPNIVGGVFGAVKKEDSPNPSAQGLSGSGTMEVLAWAIPRVLAHPIDYLRGYGRRLSFVTHFQPLLFLLAGLSWLRHRKRPQFQALGLLCSYFLLIHCFMSIMMEYFEPLWPLLAVLGAGLLYPTQEESPPLERAAAALESGFLGVNLLLCLFVYATLFSYARAPAGTGGAEEARKLEAALARHPNDSELYYTRGMRRLEAADFDVAYQDLSRAAALTGGSERVRRGEVWAGLALGRGAAFERWSASAPSKDPESLLLRGCGALIAGRLAEARAAIAEYGKLSSPGSGAGRLDLNGGLRPVITVMCRRVGALPELVPLCLDNAEASLHLARDRASAGAVLAALRKADIGPTQRRRAAELQRELGP